VIEDSELHSVLVRENYAVPLVWKFSKLVFDPYPLITSKIALSRMLGTVDINYH
tara:strand:+ start:340 stop:501 length:162 start_codon:yes stop_codon:yes gene_type:complete